MEEQKFDKKVSSVSSTDGRWKGINMVLQDEPHWEAEARCAASCTSEP